MGDLYLKRDIIESEILTCKGVSVYSALRNIMKKDRNEYYISYNLIAHELTNVGKHTRNFIEDIKVGLNELVDNGFVCKLETISKNEFILDLVQLQLKSTEEKFARISEYEMNKLFSIEGRTDKMTLFRYFTALVATFNHNDGCDRVGFMPQEYFIKRGIVNRTTLKKYNVILEENKLLYVYRSNRLVKNEDGTFRNPVNHYGRYCDKEFIAEYGKGNEKELGENDIGETIYIKQDNVKKEINSIFGGMFG